MISHYEFRADKFKIVDLLFIVLRIVRLAHIHRFKNDYRCACAYNFTAYNGEICGIDIIILGSLIGIVCPAVLGGKVEHRHAAHIEGIASEVKDHSIRDLTYIIVLGVTRSRRIEIPAQKNMVHILTLFTAVKLKRSENGVACVALESEVCERLPELTVLEDRERIRIRVGIFRGNDAVLGGNARFDKSVYGVAAADGTRSSEGNAHAAHSRTAYRRQGVGGGNGHRGGILSSALKECEAILGIKI